MSLMSREASGSVSPLVQLFIELARIPSPSGKERRIVDYLTGRLEALGLEVSEAEPPQPGEGAAGNLYCRVPGDRDGIPIFLSAHTDTVFADPGAKPEPVIADGVISSGSRAVLGADDKAAVAAIVSGVETIVREGRSHAGIELLLTVSEENGLRGAKSADLTGIDARCGFCLDSTGPVGEVIVRSPTQKTVRATFKGKSAHAGVDPEHGRSAVVAAARAVAEMELGRIDAETTANIGIIRGGEAVNVVPDRCRIAGECRSHDQEKLAGQVSQMMDAINNAATTGQVDVETAVVDEFHAFDLSGGNLPVELATDALRRIGVRPELASTGGGSDVNEFNLKGLPSVNLSVGMEKVHTPDEYITVQSLEQAGELVLALVEVAAEAAPSEGGAGP
jgi:tripeptide aminopeptidase